MNKSVGVIGKCKSGLLLVFCHPPLGLFDGRWVTLDSLLNKGTIHQVIKRPFTTDYLRAG